MKKLMGAAALCVALVSGLIFFAPAASAEAPAECSTNAAVSSFTFAVNGSGAFPTMQGNVDAGDTVTANFTVAEGCEDVRVSFASYYAPSNEYHEAQANKQKLFQSDTGLFSAGGPHALTVQVAECNFQTDFVRGEVINNLEAPDELYSAQGRLLDDAFGPATKTACQQPSAAVASNCTEKGGVATLKNDGPQPVVFSVVIDGGTPTDVEVLGNSEKTHKFGLEENQVAAVSISAPGMSTKSFSVKLDCQHPSAKIANIDCAKPGVDVTLKNISAESPVTISVQKNSEPATDVTVASGGTAVHNVAVAEGETATITVSAPGMTTVTKTVTRECDTVGETTTPGPGPGPLASGNDQARGAVLARTGPLTDPGPMAVFGLGLLLSGVALVRRARRLSIV